jgi:hypothetical protein
MKKSYMISAALVAGVLFSFDALTNSSGAPAGRSGSPASNNLSCAVSGCHSGGPAVTTQTLNITTDIPASGFLPNTDYTINVTLDAGSAGVTRAGFMASIENGGAQGTITTGGSSAVRMANTNFITHTFSGGSVSGNVKTYTFSWNSGNAPDQTTVYAAANFSNANGTTTGDVILTSSLALTKASGISLEESTALQVKMYPNPSKGVVHLENVPVSNQHLHVRDLSGRVIRTFDAAQHFDGTRWTLQLEGIPAGNYLISADEASFKVQSLSIL